MTTRELLSWLGREPLIMGTVLAALPLAALLLGFLHPRGTGNNAPWKYFYSVLVYAACVPGIFGAGVTAYVLFFTRENLLDMNVLVTLLPPLSMAVTLLIASRRVRFGPLPGFGRLSGLILTIAMTFVAVFALSRTRLWLVFGGSFAVLGIAAIVVFALLRWGAILAFGRRRDRGEGSGS